MNKKPPENRWVSLINIKKVKIKNLNFLRQQHQMMLNQSIL